MIWVLTAGLIGAETAADLLEEHRDMLEHRFPRAFLYAMEQIRRTEVTARQLEAAIPREHVLYSAPILQGGLLRSVWEACEAVSGKGLSGCRILAERIQIRQEIIEIMELFDENPYETSSGGAWVLLADDDGTRPVILSQPEEADNVFLQVIGYLTEDHDRVLEGSGFRRYLTPPVRQDKDIKARKASVQDHNKRKAEGESDEQR